MSDETVERLDEKTETAIGEYGTWCYEVGFRDGEDDQIVADKARIERDKWEDSLRNRIRELIIGAYAAGRVDQQAEECQAR